MKRFIFQILFIVLFSTTLVAQMGGPPQGGQGQGAAERPKFNSRNAAGIFYYDIDETVEELKIKSEEKDRAVAKALKLYNKEVKKLEFLNTQNFNDIDLLMNLWMSGAGKNGEKPKEAEGQDHLKSVIKDVRDKLKEEGKKLNETMEVVLSEKQLKKWIKYQKNKKKDLLPKRSSPVDSPSDNGKMSRNGFGRTPGQF